MSETPKTIEERRFEDLYAILNGRKRAYFDTKYGKCLIRDDSPKPHIVLSIVEGLADKPQMMFFINSDTGEIQAQTEGEHIKVWKDERQEISLTPEDIIDEMV